MAMDGSDMSTDVLEQLDDLLRARRNANAEQSYVASLHAKGLDKILEKVGEESTETILAAKNAATEGSRALIHETADLWFHTLVMLSHLGLDHRDVLQELERRLHTSGHVEKASRGGGPDA